ncbi:MAG: sigma-70 family RNA polymerase sigma factor [Flavobacteriales bacterium]|nr:sigma-70 family RNA polymerase sigma factor [Flavobacteriales bacterium]
MVTEALLQACIREEARAQHQLYKVLYPVMMGICTRYERDRSLAVANLNNAFLKVLRNLDTRPAHVPFVPWVRRITINTAIDAYRRSREWEHVASLDADGVDVHEGAANDFLRTMEAEAFAEMLLRLPPMSRQVFNLFAIDGYAHAEIAEMLGISEGTSKWHVNHARQLLRKALLEQASAKATTPHPSGQVLRTP